jgi:hypothetical protein
VIVNGDNTYQFSDLYLRQVQIVGSPDVGLRVAGGVGGLTLDHTDILENGENVRLDQSRQATANNQIFFGPGVAMDATNLPTIASFTGSISSTTLTVSAVASGALQVGNAVVGTSIAGNPLILSQLTGTPGGVGAYSLSVSQSTIGSEAMTSQGSGVGLHFVDPGAGSSSIMTLTGTWLATATNQLILVDSAVTNWTINYSGGDILNGNDYGNTPAMVDNESTASGVSILFAGTRFSSCCNYGKYAIYNAGTTQVQLSATTFLGILNRVSGAVYGTYSDGSDWTSINSGYAQIVAGQNVIIQAHSGNFAILGSGISSSNCGLWSGSSGSVFPGKMDTSSAGCALNLGTSAFPFSDIENQTQTINDPSTSSSSSLLLEAPTDTNGVNFKMTGNGSTTPNKYLRVLNGYFDVVSSNYGATIFHLSDAGLLNAPAFSANGTAGVSCSGTPTSSFASVNGIVTHC